MSQLPSTGNLSDLVDYVAELGATKAEIEAALDVAGIGSLALDLVLRPSGAGEVQTPEEFFRTSGLDPILARRMWLACGLPERTPFPFPVTPDAAEAIRLLVFLGQLFGDDSVLGFARVVGSAVARMAEALAATTRVGVEIPQRVSGTPYAEVVRNYTEVARDGIPPLLDAVGALFRRHLVLVSYQMWSTDENQAAVTLDRTVGFVDLVGSTEVLRRLSVRETAEMVGQFEERTWELVTQAGGRLVKLIGDEAMFVFDSPDAACATAIGLVEAAAHPVRAGLAHGPMVALHGDYYGPTVNLAALLVGVAAPESILVSSSVRDAAPAFGFEAVEVGPLRGFPEDELAYRLSRGT